MQLDVRFPLLLRGVPKRTPQTKNVYVSTTFRGEVAEYSSSDIPVVFETATAYCKLEGPLARGGQLSALGFRMRAAGGKLYRKIASSLEEATRTRMFDTAFRCANAAAQSLGTEISLRGQSQFVGPLSHDVGQELEFRMRREEEDVNALTYLWPTFRPADVPVAHYLHQEGGGQLAFRNDVGLDWVLKNIRTLEEDGLALCEDMYRHQFSKLVMIDGEFWMESRPPAYRVTPSWTEEYGTADVDMVVLPDTLDMKTDRLFFPLTETEDMEGYIERLKGVSRAAAINRPDGPVRMVEDMRGATPNLFLVDYQCSDPDLLHFDHRHEETHRLALALAVENERHLARNPQLRAKVGPELCAAVDAAHLEAMKQNTLLGEAGDPARWLTESATVWKKLGRRQSVFSFGNATLSNVTLARAFDHVEFMPISVPSVGYGV